MSPQQAQTINRSTVQKLLSTCQRCRRLRRKCDTQLPACRPCQKAGVECMFVDQALQQTIPRSYVQSLLLRLEHLEALKDDLRDSSDRCTSAPPAMPSPASTSAVSSQTSHGKPFKSSFDVQFIVQQGSGNTSRFFGSSSVFALTVEVLNHARSKGILSDDPSGMVDARSTEAEKDLPPRSIPAIEDMRALVSHYFSSMNKLYGFMDASTVESELDSYMKLRSSSHLHGSQAHQYFRVSMVCAIACANQARYRPTRTAESMAFYADALTCIEEVTSEVSPASLQALLLLVLFCLFHPRKGDIWKLLDYARRLSIELGYHNEQELGCADESQRHLQRSTFWGLYAIERIVGQLFGRGSDVPEFLITTEYPNAMQVAGRDLGIAYHYRLVYLRSEIYRDIYLPVALPDFDLQWYKDRHATLLAWRQELDLTEDVTSVATVTCDVRFHATFCFLFQPLMLRALSKTAEPATGDDDAAVIPQENYWAACELIKTYERVLHAPQDSTLGSYPMTFLSAHYIYLAGLTLIAHYLLALDDRAIALDPLTEDTRDTALHGRRSDFASISEVTGSCLVLLGWCADKFPGMEGMLAVFKKLSEKVVPASIRKGLA